MVSYWIRLNVPLNIICAIVVRLEQYCEIEKYHVFYRTVAITSCVFLSRPSHTITQRLLLNFSVNFGEEFFFHSFSRSNDVRFENGL
jgi:hypothetical protein